MTDSAPPTMPDEPTPRTEEELADFGQSVPRFMPRVGEDASWLYVRADFARQLEREGVALRRNAERWQWLKSKRPTEFSDPGIDAAMAINQALAEAAEKTGGAQK